MKNRYYDRKARESLRIDMEVVRYGQDKVLNTNRDIGNFVKTNAWKPLFKINENTPLKFGVILYFVILISLKTASTSVAEISRFK